MLQGIPATSQSIQVGPALSVRFMKPTARTFCAAEVMMPTFQTLVAWATIIMIEDANTDRRSTPKAAMMPAMMGTAHAVRAVAEGTRNESNTVIAIALTRMLRGPVPMIARVRSAMRRSSPLAVIATEMNSAAPTSASAELANPAKPICSPLTVPSQTPGSFGLGEVPSRNAIMATMTTDDTA